MQEGTSSVSERKNQVMQVGSEGRVRDGATCIQAADDRRDAASTCLHASLYTVPANTHLMRYTSSCSREGRERRGEEMTLIPDVRRTSNRLVCVGREM